MKAYFFSQGFSTLWAFKAFILFIIAVIFCFHFSNCILINFSVVFLIDIILALVHGVPMIFWDMYVYIGLMMKLVSLSQVFIISLYWEHFFKKLLFLHGVNIQIWFPAIGRLAVVDWSHCAVWQSLRTHSFLLTLTLFIGLFPFLSLPSPSSVCPLLFYLEFCDKLF